MLPKLSDSAQTISFTEGEGVCSVEVLSSEVLVNTTPSSPTHGSSKVKLKSLVDYNWECKFYSGRLLAMHMTGNYLAYSIKAPNTVTPGNWSGMVRVVYNGEPGVDRRALVKGMKGEVHDVSFAHIEHQILLACIDEQGNFYVHDIELTDSGLRCSLLAEIREDTGLTCAHHRVVWCPYIPDEDDAPDDDVARLLLTTHGSTARMWNLRQIISQLESSGEKAVAASTLLAGPGVLTASEHTAPIVDAAFSPDGTALATAAADGYVMFFQVYMSNATTPRCLHKWLPHAGKPLSCLFFLDNHKNYNSDVQFWKFAVTGAENNTTLKIWSCKSWSCLQTITFTAGLPTEPSTLGLKAMLDTSASYLILSDSKNKSLFILHMARDSDDTTAYCKSISEFLLPYPVLSFCIVDAGEHPGPCESSCGDPYHRTGGSAAASPADDYEPPEEEGLLGACTAGARRVRVQLYIVQPKGLQHGELSFPPPAPAPPALVPPSLGELELGDEASDSAPAAIASSILQQQSQQLKNLLMRSQTQPGSLIGTRPESPAAAPPPPLNLMTPDAFSSPGKRDEEDPPLSATPDVAGAHRNSTSGFPPAPPRSTGSSPSREVQEIMASDHRHYYKDMTDEPSQSPEPALAEPDLPAPLQNGDAAFYPEQPPLDSSRASELLVSPPGLIHTTK
ncbi:hypothetical protein JYU34_002932 [Plutella xylostella]|uniref:Enhancer of mRNA-decapping protein 4 WD40 repeat region domain-containing protein n=1 Tax=Plutella xylostella TaxID=51655 RepID=A0ABQ7R3I8_PLUXY|nr:hypothetical protein JYU34_002932 [Plutella xylostella]